MAALLTLGLYSVLAAASALVLWRRAPKVATLDEALVRLALLAVCIVAYFVGPRVYGLEYEDAFVHEAASLWRSSHWLAADDGFFVTVCLAGSAAECVTQGSFGTQLIGLSTLAALLHSLVGSSTGFAAIVSAIAGALSLQIVWSMLVRHVASNLARAIAVVLMTSATSFYIISGSGFAEPLFTLFLLIHLHCHLTISESAPNRRMGVALWALLFAAGALMILAKKEGALLLIVLGVYDGVVAWQKRRDQPLFKSRDFALFSISIGLLCFAFFVVRILDAAERHSVDIGQSAFNPMYLVSLARPFCEAALAPDYFGLVFWLFVLVSPIALYRGDRVTRLLFGILAGFSLLYTLHARHRAFVDGAAVEPEEMIRYLYVLTPLAAIFVSRGLVHVLHQNRRAPSHRSRLTPGSATALLAIFSFVFVMPNLYQQRTDMAADEHRNRTSVLDSHASHINGIVYVSPYPAALAAVLGKSELIVDSSVVEDPTVMTWLRLQIGKGMRLAVDPDLCGPTMTQWVAATCQTLAKLSAGRND
jgi:hypothetical protein